MKYLKDASLGYALALLTYIRLGWKGLLRTNTLDYYEHSYITDPKSFVTLVPGIQIVQIFNAILNPKLTFKKKKFLALGYFVDVMLKS